MQGSKFLDLIGNIAFWIFVAGMLFAVFKLTYGVAAVCLFLSIFLFVIFIIGKLIYKLTCRK